MKLELKNDCMTLSLNMKDCDTDQTTTSKVDPSNPKNPYDEVGAAHNAALDHLARKFAGSDIVIQDDLMMTGWVIEDNVMLKATISFLESYPFKDIDVKELLRDKSELIIEELGQWDPRPGEIPLNDTFPQKTLNAVAEWRERLRKGGVPIDVLGYGLKALDQGLIDHQGYIEQIKRMEAAAMSAKISSEDLEGLLVVASVARYSTAHSASNPVSAKSASGPIGSDVKGAASGMAAGFVTGIGILIGGAVGAIVRSAAYVATSKAISA